VNDLGEGPPPAGLPAHRTATGALQTIVRTVLYNCQPGATQDPSVYVGDSGIAYALYHLSTRGALPDIKLLDYARGYANSAFSLTEQMSEDFPLSHFGCSFLCGHAGVYALCAILEQAAGTQSRSAPFFVEKFLSLIPHALAATSKEHEFLYGRAGFLRVLLLMRQHFGEAGAPMRAVLEVAAQIVEAGKALAKSMPELQGHWPLMWSWHDKCYLGAAHGLMGILYMLLHVPTLLADPALKQDIVGTIQQILKMEIRWGGRAGGDYPAAVGRRAHATKAPLVHWCHGAPGAVFLFTKAVEVLGDPSGEFISAAERAASVVWDRGLLKKGPGICHGVAGNGYVLLCMYRATGATKWLCRAQQFGHFIANETGRQDWQNPDRPYSLFEGVAGTACFLADLQDPENARFPLFEM